MHRFVWNGLRDAGLMMSDECMHAHATKPEDGK